MTELFENLPYGVYGIVLSTLSPNTELLKTRLFQDKGWWMMQGWWGLCYRDHSVYAPSQWEIAVYFNAAYHHDHWLGIFTEWSGILHSLSEIMTWIITQTCRNLLTAKHYNDVIMGSKASQMTSITIVYSAVYSDADQRKHQSSASLAFVRGIHRGPANSPYKWPVTRKMFPFDDVNMKYPTTLWSP